MNFRKVFIPVAMGALILTGCAGTAPDAVKRGYSPAALNTGNPHRDHGFRAAKVREAEEARREAKRERREQRRARENGN